MRKTIDFIRKYWFLAKEVVLVLAAILYFIIGFRIAPLVSRVGAIESENGTIRETLRSLADTDVRIESKIDRLLIKLIPNNSGK